VLDKAEYSAFESKLNSAIVSYRIVLLRLVSARVLYMYIYCKLQASSRTSDSIKDDVFMCVHYTVHVNYAPYT